MEGRIKIRLKYPDFKNQKAVDFFTAFCIYADLNLNNSDVGFGSPFRIMRTLLHGTSHPVKAPFSNLLEKISLLWLTFDSLRILNDNCLTSSIVHHRLPDEPPQLVIRIVALRIRQNWISQ